jgi:hypothetical protein
LNVAGKSDAWVLSVPFIVAPALEFETEVTETFGKVRLTVRSASFGYSRFLFEGFDSAEDARRMFSTLKAGALGAGLYAGCGVRITDDLLELNDTTPLPSELDRPMVYREGRDLSGIFLHAGEPRFIASKVVPRFMEGLRTGLTFESVSIAMQNQRVQLAALLYADSYFEKSPQARFLALIGVLEVLKDHDPISTDAQKLIDRFVEEVKQADVPEAQSLTQRLGYLKTVSINQGIRSMVRRHLGDEAARNVGKLYDHRSRLVHNGAVAVDIDTVVGQAQVLVMQLMAKILSKGAV